MNGAVLVDPKTGVVSVPDAPATPSPLPPINVELDGNKWQAYALGWNEWHGRDDEAYIIVRRDRFAERDIDDATTALYYGLVVPDYPPSERHAASFFIGFGLAALASSFIHGLFG